MLLLLLFGCSSFARPAASSFTFILQFSIIILPLKLLVSLQLGPLFATEFGDSSEPRNFAASSDLSLLLLLLLLLFVGQSSWSFFAAGSRLQNRFQRRCDVLNESEEDDGLTTTDDAHARFQLILTRFRGGPMGGICWVARARNASFIRCGWVVTMFFQPTVSTTSVA
jgi:hypothetical protein